MPSSIFCLSSPADGMTIARRSIKDENYGTRPQTVLYRISSEHVILLAAPMPGLEPQNISVSMRDNVVQIKGEERGPRQHELDLKLAEWRIGPYFREA